MAVQRRWFLSYNSQDLQLAQALAAELARKDSRAPIFFAPASLRPGAYWMPALAKEIAEATAFVLLVGERGLGLPAGEFMMGSPANEKDRISDEGPQHKVTIARAFAVSRFEVTFDKWDACFYLGGCAYQPGDQGWGRGSRPVIAVSWEDAQKFAAWLSKQTGKPYRLLSEAEWEYAARAGSDKAYSWGDEIGEGNANCADCGSEWDNEQTAPVGSFAANAFGLHDMHGNVWEWVEDCYQDNYNGAPTDGSARTSGACNSRVLRGGSWGRNPDLLRSARRGRGFTDYRGSSIGFRVGRTLTP